MIFKEDDRMKAEWFLLLPKLQLIILDIINWGIRNGEEPVWTSFYRTPEEQLALYEAKKSDYKVSVHMFYRGADFRLFQQSELNYCIKSYINDKYPYGDVTHFTLLMEGQPIHHHVQIKDDNAK